MWLTFASACGLAVARDTANGSDQIHTWPGPIFIDWILDPLYMFNALCLGALPGTGLAWLLSQYGFFGSALAPAGLFFFFPIVMLSMLETNSPFGAVSMPVWRTFVKAFMGWAKFYLATAILLTAAPVAVAALSNINYLGTVIAGTTLALAWLIYFRLLGRLAWYCSEHSAVEEDEEAEEIEEEEELMLLDE